MDNFSITTMPSPSSSNSSSHTPEINYQRPPPPQHYRSALHSVRKNNVITKKPIAPMPPTPPKIYKVNPVDFRDVVQRLTGALPQPPTRARLHEVAPPPLRLSPPLSSGGGSVEEEMHSGNCGGLSPLPLGFSLSPSSVAWCSSILMSPGTLSS